MGVGAPVGEGKDGGVGMLTPAGKVATEIGGGGVAAGVLPGAPANIMQCLSPTITQPKVVVLNT